MEFEGQVFKVRTLIEHFEKGLVVPNPEYQRGLQWDTNQMRSLIDSLFRKYPLPPIFLHERSFEGLRGQSRSLKYEIVDGQQRIRSLLGFRNNDYQLLETSDKHLKIPNSLRQAPAPWQGCTYNTLPLELRRAFDNHDLHVYLITAVNSDDEIRDLFIRLQAGKPLTPQQVRDAWPGPVGPYVEKLAGKLTRVPCLRLFEKVDRRGIKEEEAVDERVNHRVICAQLLLLFLERSRHAENFCPVSSKYLDQLYHENTELPEPTTQRFERLLKQTEEVVEHLIEISKQEKVRKLELMAIFCLLHDMSYLNNIRMENAHYRKVAQLVKDLPKSGGGKSTSLRAIQSAANGLSQLARNEPEMMIRLDDRREFSDDQKREIKVRQKNLCGVCGKPVEQGDSEYDHHPVSWARGGPTEVSNGRLVHTRCHPRYGRLPED